MPPPDDDPFGLDDGLIKFFLLNDDHSLRPVRMMEWAQAFGASDRRVAFTGNETKYVSTVFLGLDHRFFGDGPPLVFETMVFVDEGKTIDLGGKIYPNHTSIDQERYGSWAAAEAGHKRMVERHLLNPVTRVTARAEEDDE